MRTNVIPRTDSVLVLPGGRRIAYAQWGDLDGRPVVLLHGIPGSRLLCPDEDATVAAGVRLLTIDRPGYGGSDPCPGLTLQTWTDDCAQLLEHLGVGPCPVLGWSGGAAYALALAFYRPGLVSRLALSAGAGPVDDVPGAYEALAEGDRALIERVRTEGHGARAAVLEDGRSFSDQPAALLPPDGNPDFVGRPDVPAALLVMFGEAARQGPDGYADDFIAQFAQPWGFRVAEVTCPVDVWWGEQDVLVGREHADYFVRTLTNSTLHLVPTAGHGLPTGHWPELLEALTR